MGIRRSALIRTVLIAVAVFGVMQLVRPDRSNPPTNQAATLSAHVAVPRDVATILDRSCHDCHSHDTRWPWYSHVAPVSWLVAHDVQEAREHMNFSTWSARSRDDQLESLEEICKEVKKGGMPIGIYLQMHREATLTASDVETLCAWSKAAVAALPGSDTR